MHRKLKRDSKRKIKTDRSHLLRFENSHGKLISRTTTFVTEKMKIQAKKDGKFRRD